jgi:hypothetical protein
MPDANPQADAPAFERGLWSRPWFIAILCLAFVEIDWEMVPLKVFPFVFVFPLMLVAWNRSLKFALACAAVLSSTRLAHQLVFDGKEDMSGEVADALVCFFVLMLLAALTNLLGRQSRQLRRRVQMLEGILPICAGCKSIRDEKNNWIQLEGYITSHSKAHFSHGFCPECYRKFSGHEPPPGAGAK